MPKSVFRKIAPISIVCCFVGAAHGMYHAAWCADQGHRAAEAALFSTYSMAMLLCAWRLVRYLLGAEDGR